MKISRLNKKTISIFLLIIFVISQAAPLKALAQSSLPCAQLKSPKTISLAPEQVLSLVAGLRRNEHGQYALSLNGLPLKFVLKDNLVYLTGFSNFKLLSFPSLPLNSLQGFPGLIITLKSSFSETAQKSEELLSDKAMDEVAKIAASALEPLVEKTFLQTNVQVGQSIIETVSNQRFINSALLFPFVGKVPGLFLNFDPEKRLEEAISILEKGKEQLPIPEFSGRLGLDPEQVEKEHQILALKIKFLNILKTGVEGLSTKFCSFDAQAIRKQFRELVAGILRPEIQEAIIEMENGEEVIEAFAGVGALPALKRIEANISDYKSERFLPFSLIFTEGLDSLVNDKVNNKVNDKLKEAGVGLTLKELEDILYFFESAISFAGVLHEIAAETREALGQTSPLIPEATLAELINFLPLFTQGSQGAQVTYQRIYSLVKGVIMGRTEQEKSRLDTSKVGDEIRADFLTLFIRRMKYSDYTFEKAWEAARQEEGEKIAHGIYSAGRWFDAIWFRDSWARAYRLGEGAGEELLRREWQFANIDTFLKALEKFLNIVESHKNQKEVQDLLSWGNKLLQEIQEEKKK